MGLDFVLFFSSISRKRVLEREKGKHGGPAHGTDATLLHSQATHPKSQKKIQNAITFFLPFLQIISNFM